MNWTGGELTRAAPTKAKTLRQKQKAHFARARAAAAVNHSRSASHQSRRDTQLQASRTTHTSGHGPDFSQPVLSNISGIDMDEYRLLLKRQELLRRPDWLELQVTKPLNIAFPPRSDKALIGRRRGIQSVSASRLQPRQYDSVSALPRRGFNMKKMSSQEASLNIKIGTNALDSQTQQSLAYKPSAKASLQSLSEEPMLLDSDDDLFERWSPDGELRISHRTQDNLEAADRQIPDLSITTDRDDLSAQSQLQGFADLEDHHPTRLELPLSSSEEAPSWSTSVIKDIHGRDVPWSTGAPSRSVAAPIVLTDTNNNYERDWRRLCGIGTSSYANASLIVQHAQQQSSSSPSALPFTRLGDEQHETQTALPCRPDIGNGASVQRLSMPTKHKQPNIETNKPTLPLKALHNTAQQSEEELWRKFILGDAHSDSEDSLPTVPPRRSHILDSCSSYELQPLSFLRSEGVNESVVATRGAPTCAIPSSKGMRGPNSSLDGMISSTPSTIRTAAATAASSMR